MLDHATVLALALAELGEPLRRRFASPEALEYGFHRYGWIAGLDDDAFERVRQGSPVVEAVDGLLLAAGEVRARLDADPAAEVEPAQAADLALAGQSLIVALADSTPSSLTDLPAPLGEEAFWESVAEHLADDLLEEYLRIHHPGAFLVLRLWRVIRYDAVEPEGAFRRPYTRVKVDWDQALAMVSEPLPALKRAYRWGDPAQPFEHAEALLALGDALGSARLPATVTYPAVARDLPFEATPARRIQEDATALRTLLLRSAGADQSLYEVGFDVYPAARADESHPSGLLIRPRLAGGAGQSVRLGDFDVRWQAAASLAEAVGFAIFPDGADVVGGQPAFGTRLELRSARSAPWTLLGRAGSARVEVSDLSLAFSMGGSPGDPEVELRLALGGVGGEPGCRVVIPLADADGFVRSAAGDRAIELAFSTEVLWSNRSGLTFGGRPSIDVDLPLRIPWGPVALVGAKVAVTARREEGVSGVALRAVTAVHGRLGPAAFVVDGLGVAMDVERRQAGAQPAPRRGRAATTLAGLDVSVGFQPPDGVGLAIDAGPVKGGGFLRFDDTNGSYGGALELQVGRLAVKAFGLLTVRPAGYSLIAVLSAEFPQPINLAFGWRLSGVGGLIAFHHRLDAAALQQGLRSGIAEKLLFPADPVGAAPEILAALATAFPPAAGRFLFGPSVRLLWGERDLATLTAALVLELPAPMRLLVLGRLDVTAPHKEAAVLVLRVEFAGVIDFERPSFAFDAVLMDSRIGPFALAGDVAVRFRGGEEGMLLITAGGFHPQFPVPVNAALPPLNRISVALSTGTNPRARLEMYTAITSSTWQIGGKLEVAASAAGFQAEAMVSLDAIFGEIEEGGRTRSGFVADIQGRATIRRGSSTIASVGLALRLSGPEPWHVKGKASVSLFLFSVSIPFEGSFGDRPERPALPLVDAGALLRTALLERANWETAVPAAVGPLVTLAPRPVAPEALLAHPLGRVAVRQHAVPLDVEITRVGGARTAAERFEIAAVTVDGDAPSRAAMRSHFAAAQYLELTEAERLTRPAFEPMVAGFELDVPSSSFGTPQVADLSYEEVVLGPDGPLADPVRGRPALGVLLAHAAALGAAGTAAVRRDERPPARGIRVSDVAPLIVDAATLQPVELPDGAAPGTFTEAAQLLARRVRSGAAAPDTLVLVGAHEAT